MKRLLATVEYRGDNYYGWEKQENVNSIQETIEKVLSKILNNETHIYASGRTDRGVHALGQTFHFDVLKDSFDIERLVYGINCLLPDDIKILSLKEVKPDFSARISAKEKVYEYRFSLENVSVFDEPYMISVLGDFDMERLKEGISFFLGKHDFRNFTTKEQDEVLDYKRTIYNIDIVKNENYYSLIFKGDGFMRYMIRILVGTLISYSLKKIDKDYIISRLDTNKENMATYKAPAKGLYLKEVIY